MKIKIEKLIFEGFGLGREIEEGSFGSVQDCLKNKPVFVRKAVPGDILEVETIKNKKSFVEAKIKRIVELSPDRITAKCPYFNQCGGCEHQNISIEKQLEFKEAVFAETLSRAKVEIKPEKIVCASDPFYYRNSIRFFFNLNKDNQISFARHHYLYNKGLTEIDRCMLQSETANRILSELKKFINEKVEHKTPFWQLKIREGKFTGEFMVEIITSDESLPEQKGIVEVLKNIPSIKSIYHTIAPAKSLKHLRRKLIFGSPIIFEKIGRYKFQISPESFFQTNSLGVETLYNKIKEYAQVKAGDNILDLYCGTGSIGIYLSTLAKKVVGVEVVPEATRDAKDNVRINHIHNCEFINANAGEIRNLKLEIRNSDVVVVDPPRAGLSQKLISDICNLDFGIIIYVSCNPATFARDVKIFEKNNIFLKKVQPIDMFPQTHHIECVGILKKPS